MLSLLDKEFATCGLKPGGFYFHRVCEDCHKLTRKFRLYMASAVKAPGTPSGPPERTTPAKTVLPAADEKHDYVRAMFDAIAPRYDLLNSVLSARLHHGWRRHATRLAKLQPGDSALDVCSGTGDFAFELAQRVGPNGRVAATDFSVGMLRLGEAKRAQRTNGSIVTFSEADTQSLPFPSDTFDAVTVGFGIRNVADIDRGIAEMARVAKPGGRVIILEFNQPTNPVFAVLYRWYSFRILPLLGGLISGRRTAYEYLPSSVAAFHSREELAKRMRNVGLTDVVVTDLTFGTVAIHCGVKSAATKA